MATSIVIPAHNEESVLGRCLDAIVGGASPGELEVVVVCNGCTDRTADVARRYGDAVRVIDTPVASKANALNLGDEAVSGFPRLYVDADVVLAIGSARALRDRLESPGALAAAPAMRMDYSAASRAVRAFYDVWTRMPYTREGMIGVGVYALSREGRGRFGRFPDVIADDGYVRMLFTVAERQRVDEAPVTVAAPATIADLVKIMTRSRLGGFELASKFPDLVAREQAGKSYGGALGVVAMSPWLWPAAVVYLWVNLASRVRARRQLRRREAYVWERDASSRRPSG